MSPRHLMLTCWESWSLDPASTCFSCIFLHFDTSSGNTSTPRLVVDASILVLIFNQSTTDVHSTLQYGVHLLFSMVTAWWLVSCWNNHLSPAVTFQLALLFYLCLKASKPTGQLGVEKVYTDHIRSWSWDQVFISRQRLDFPHHVLVWLVPLCLNTCSAMYTGPSFQFILPTEWFY